MAQSVWSVSIVLGCLLAAGVASAHHSTQVYFDTTKRVTVTGTLLTVDWRNPHIEFSVETKDGQGQTQPWRIESMPPNWFARHKVSKADLAGVIGQTVTIVVLPARDGSLYGNVVRITLPDGKVIAVRDRP